MVAGRAREDLPLELAELSVVVHADDELVGGHV
jgi:hypothetical protein